MKVKKAVIPAAGLGTRFLPATKSIPKEMLTVVDRPIIHYVVEEAVKSGIDDILIITGDGKEAIENYFDKPSKELVDALKRKGREKELERIMGISEIADIHYIRQGEPLGLGHAISRAKSHVDGEPFAVLLGDDIIDSKVPCMQQLMEVYGKYGGMVVATEEVVFQPEKYGMIVGEHLGGNIYKITDMVEKPKEPVSNMAIVGRYVLKPEIFDHIGGKGHGGEIQITDALRKMISDGIYALKFEGKRYDCGNPEEWLRTNIELGKKDRSIF